MHRKIFAIGIVILFLLNSGFVFAGMEYMLKCQNKNCNYSTKIDFGRGMGFGMITGYCMTCSDFTYIQWDLEEKKPHGEFSKDVSSWPDPIAKIWDLNTNEPISLYKCQKCSKPFAPIRQIKDVQHCPKCGQRSLSVKETGLLYD
jgi:DNA-directed RNA polymerase subunit RPC12/RpoP